MKRTVILSVLVMVLLAMAGSGPAQADTGEGVDLRTAAPAAAGPTAKPIALAQEEQPSKIAYIIRDRIKKVEAALRAAGPQRVLSSQAVSELSDNLLRVNSAGEILLEFHSAHAVSSAEKADLEARGATIVINTADLVWPEGTKMPSDLGIIVAWIPHNRVETAAEQISWIVAVTPVEDNPPDVGAFLSEGVALHNADDVQAAGVDGTGVTVGAISDGVTNLAASQGLGDLPAVVTIPGGCGVGAGDEGTAMLETIYDMAPGAALQFCATGGGVVNHVAAQNNLVAAGADVIAEDIPFDSQPAFQQGFAASNGDAIAAAGVSMHSSAGNRGAQHAARVAAVGTGGGPDGATGPFAGCPFTPDNVVAIAPGGDTTFDVTMRSLQVTLQWSEPRAIFPTAGAGGFTDLNLYVMDAALTTCLGSSVAVQGNGAGDTIEQVFIPFDPGPAVAVKIVVDVQSISGAVAVPTIDLRWRGSGAISTDAPTRNGSLNPDSNYTGLATSSAAANASVSTNPNTVPLEGFSSGGPVQLLLTTVCPGGVYPCPGASIAGPPGTTVGAPNWTAADGVSVSGVGGFGSGTCPGVVQGDCRFFGTSASTPHAAACDALVRQGLGGPPAIAVINGRLAGSATDRGPAGFDNAWGAGVLDCLRAAQDADLVVTKTDSPDPVIAGTNLTYNLQVTNNGPDDAPGVVLTDILPPGVSFDSYIASQGTYDSGTGEWDVGSLASGASATLTIVVSVDPTTADGTILTNTAEVTSDVTDPDLSDNTATADTLVITEADLAVTKTDSPDPVIAGTNLTYNLQVTNNGPNDATDVVLTDILPPEVSFDSYIASQGTYDSGTGEWDVGSLASGANATLTIVVSVDPTTADGTILTNTAEVTSDVTDPDLSDNTATADTLVITEADLSVTKTDFYDPMIVGLDQTYTLQVSNGGPSYATNVLVTDTLPPELSFESSPDGCTETVPDSGIVTCSLASLANGATAMFDIIVSANPETAAGTIVTNTVEVTSDTTDPDPGNNTASEDTLVERTECDLTVPGANIIVGTVGDDILTGTEGVDIIISVGGSDTIHGLGGCDCLDGGDGDDEIFGDQDDDVIFGGKGGDVIFGGKGGDVIFGGKHSDTIEGGPGNDEIFGGDGHDEIDGGTDHDEIEGGPGNDEIRGGRGHDEIDGGTDHDEIEGGPGNDEIRGGHGHDEIDGGTDHDEIEGGPGNDEIRGGRGNDKIEGGPGNDEIDGGLGTDECENGEEVIACES